MPLAGSCIAARDTRIDRVFRLDTWGCIVSAEIIAADSDEDAGIIARTLPNGHGLALWERTRRLGRYPRYRIADA